MTFDRQITTLPVIDPYNDFISQRGMVWNRLRDVAEAHPVSRTWSTSCHAARKAQLRVFYALHRVENLNQLLADTITLRDLYKKHHWQVAGPTFYQLHLLFDKHYEQQNEHRNLRSELITKEDLMAQLREQGVEDVSDVKSCFLEGDGRIA